MILKYETFAETDNGEKSDTFTNEYFYQIGVVTDEEMQKPDLSGYQITNAK